MATDPSHDSRAGAIGGLLVAIVDDDTQRAAHTATVASELGADTVQCADADTLDAELTRRAPALVIAAAGPLGMASLDAAESMSQAPLVVLLHGPAEIPTVVEAMRRGAFDYLAAPVDPKEMRDRIRAAIETARLQREDQERRAASAKRVARLSRRMRILAEEIMAGRSSAEIARRWGVSERTIAGHRATLMRAMGAQNTAELVRLLVEGGFFPRSTGDSAGEVTHGRA